MHFSPEAMDVAQARIAALERERDGLKAELDGERGRADSWRTAYQDLSAENHGARSALDATCEELAAAQARVEALGLTDALRIARGCFDYSGGHRELHLEAFRHGIQTVVNALESAAKNGLKDTQVAALHRMGSPPAPDAQREEGRDL